MSVTIRSFTLCPFKSEFLRVFAAKILRIIGLSGPAADLIPAYGSVELPALPYLPNDNLRSHVFAGFLLAEQMGTVETGLRLTVGIFSSDKKNRPAV